MKLFACQSCGNLLYFENTACERCPSAGIPAGPGNADGAGARRRRVHHAGRAAGDRAVLRECRARRLQLAGRADAPGAFCPACRHNQHHPRPDGAGEPGALAQHRVRQAPAVLRADCGSACRCRTAARTPSTAGVRLPGRRRRRAGPKVHDRARQRPDHPGAEGGRRRRARPRCASRWASRTARCSAISATRSGIITGTCWCATAASWTPAARCSATRASDYDEALQRHYAEGAPAGLAGAASSAPTPPRHPWEDFAETWAHYLHIVDTLETAAAFGMKVAPRGRRSDPTSIAEIDFDPYHAPTARSGCSTTGCR